VCSRSGVLIETILSGCSRARVAALYEKLAYVAVPISSVPFEIDLRQDGERKIAVIHVEVIDVTKQAQCILSDLTPRACPFHHKKQFVCN
jgi:hypothetical protein